MSQDLSLNEISERIADAILSDRYLNKGRIMERVRPILKIWLKRADSVKKHRSKTASVHKYQWTIEKKQHELRFWHERFRTLVGENAMKEHYEILQRELHEMALDDYKNPVLDKNHRP